MSLLVTGSIGVDTVRTPHGVSENCLGGSAVYFSLAASFFSPVRFVGAVGADCPFDLGRVFAGRQVDLSGLEVRQQSRTFRWSATYGANMDERTTDSVELNVLGEAPPAVPAAFADSEFIFLANTAPKLQHGLLSQVRQPVFVAADTMDCWIKDHLGDLKSLLTKIDCLILNEDEARLLAGEHNLVKAGRAIVGMGLGIVVIKKGASGSLTCGSAGEVFALPAYPAAEVKDPTGAGDSFAGGLMGYLAQCGRTDFGALKTAIAYGTVTASFAIADFSVQGLVGLGKSDIEGRLDSLRKATSF